MKKTILTLSCFFNLLLAAQSQIIITEIMYNPPESGNDSLEYIELFNSGNSAVNMENWSLFGVEFTFPAITVQPGGYLLISINAAALQNQLGVSSLQWTGNALSNGGEPIKVLDNNGVVVDSVTYDDAAPWPTSPDDGGPSLVLCDYNSDNSLAANWQAATTTTGVTINGKEIFANPGAASNCPTTIKANPDFFNVFTGGQTANLAVLGNDQLPGAGVTVVVTTPPQHGSADVNADNTIAYTPNAGYCGNDAFVYTACVDQDCDTALVTLFIPCYPQYDIAEVTGVDANGVADSLDVTCELNGFVYGVNTRASTTGLQFTLINSDNSAGINVFSPAQTFGYTVKEGDQLSIRGVIDQFSGLTEIIPHALTKVSEGNPLAAPEVVVIPDEDTESRLIRINNLHFVDTLQWTTTGNPSGFNVRAVSDDHPLDTIVIRIDNDVNLYSQPVPPQPFDLTGIGGQFDDDGAPYDSAYQIAPRYIPDISTLVRIKEADFSANVSLTPNPASDRLLLQTDLQFERVRIFSASGALVKTLENPAQTHEIQVNTLPDGVYFVQFEQNGGMWTTRFVKM